LDASAVLASSSDSCRYMLRLSGGSLAQVDLECFIAITASVDLLAIVWPSGFLDFDNIADMPKPPVPHRAGRLQAALCEDSHLQRYGEELNRRLLEEIDQRRDSLILCCAFASIEAVLEVVKHEMDERLLGSYGASESHTPAMDSSTASGCASAMQGQLHTAPGLEVAQEQQVFVQDAPAVKASNTQKRLEPSELADSPRPLKASRPHDALGDDGVLPTLQAHMSNDICDEEALPISQSCRSEIKSQEVVSSDEEEDVPIFQACRSQDGSQ